MPSPFFAKVDAAQENEFGSSEAWTKGAQMVHSEDRRQTENSHLDPHPFSVASSGSDIDYIGDKAATIHARSNNNVSPGRKLYFMWFIDCPLLIQRPFAH
jgi:hypothetical protein